MMRLFKKCRTRKELYGVFIELAFALVSVGVCINDIQILLLWDSLSMSFNIINIVHLLFFASVICYIAHDLLEFVRYN